MLNNQTLLLNMQKHFSKSKKKEIGNIFISIYLFINIVIIPSHIITIILEIVLLVKKIN